VPVGGLGREHQRAGDLARGQAAADEGEDLGFTGGEPGQEVDSGPAVVSRAGSAVVARAVQALVGGTG
jgi:hypothetical protein